MGLLNKDTFVCIDLETTGLDPNNDRIIEVAIIRFRFDAILERFETLIDPETIIPESSIAIHKITPNMLVGKPKIKEVLPKILTMLEDTMIVGHGVGFDIAILLAALQRACISSPKKIPFIDTLRMARIYGESPTNSLEKLREHFHIQLEGAHRAMNDVIVNIEVFKKLAKSYKKTEDILKALSKPIILAKMPLGKHKGR